MRDIRFCAWIIIFACVAFGLADAAAAQCEPLGWSSLGNGVSGGPQPRVLALAQFDDGSGRGPTIHAGGEFTRAGSVAAVNIARWNGSTWQALDSELNGPVRALMVFDDGNGPALFAGGDFTLAGNVPVNRIAKWNGRTWSALSEGIPVGSVRCMSEFDDGAGVALYVGGTFTIVGGVRTNNIARWNGKNWSAVGAGLGGAGEAVNALATFKSNGSTLLYVGGSFAFPSSPRIVAWNGTAWLGLGGADGTINALEACTLEPLQGLFVGGAFTEIGGINAQALARWTGEDWTKLPAPEWNAGEVTALSALNDRYHSVLYVGGRTSGYISPLPLQRWDGRQWFSANTVDGFIWSLATVNDASGSSVYVGGDFRTIGSLPMASISRLRVASPSFNCNHNRTIDSCDLNSGTSSDCNGDGVPDECEVADTYRLDGGVAVQAYGLANGGDYLWLNQFTVRPHAQFIDVVSLPWSPFGADGLSVRVLIYADPNGDGDPSDAVLLADTATENFFEDWSLPFAKIRVPHVFVGPVGRSFFIAAFSRSATPSFVAIGDNSIPLQVRSWRRYDALGSIDVHHPAQGGSIDSVADRNWMLRAISMDCNSNGVWDDCDIESGTSHDANHDGVPDECEVVCEADIAPPGGNGAVNADDLVFVITNWSTTGSGPADINHDNIVNIDDLVAVITAWGPCPQ